MKLMKKIGWWNGQKRAASLRSVDCTSGRSAKWQAFRVRSLSSTSSRFTDSSDLDSDSDDFNSTPEDVPEGCLVVYVGLERRRFVIHAHCLNHPLFKAILERSAEEYGFHHEGGLIIACEVAVFERLLAVVGNNDHVPRNYVHISRNAGSCLELEEMVPSSETRPLL